MNTPKNYSANGLSLTLTPQELTISAYGVVVGKYVPVEMVEAMRKELEQLRQRAA